MSENGDNQREGREGDEYYHQDREYEEQRQVEENNNSHEDDQNATIHVNGDEIGFKISEDSLKSFFEKYGEVTSVSIIRDPATRTSRRFCFVNMARAEDCIRAVAEMENGQIDGFDVRCQRAKRKQGYEKTPGQYLGPPGLSSKYVRDRRDRDRRFRSRDRGDRRDRDRSRDRFRDRSRDRYPPSRDFDRGYDRGYDQRGQGRDNRGFDPRDARDSRGFDPRDYRGPAPRYDMDPRGPPPHFADSRGPPPSYDNRGGRSPQPLYRTRSPPHQGGRADDRGFEGGRAPPVANYAASSYYANANVPNNGRGGPAPTQQLPPRY